MDSSLDGHEFTPNVETTTQLYLRGYMPKSDPNAAARQAALAKALRAVRRHRRLGVGWMAWAMDMPVRTYQHFEAGKGRINIEQVFRFAEVTDCDPIALFIATINSAPQLAVRCADNKLALALVKNLDAFDAEVGDSILALRAATIQQVIGLALDLLTIEAVTWAAPTGLRQKRRTPDPEAPQADAVAPQASTAK